MENKRKIRRLGSFKRSEKGMRFLDLSELDFIPEPKTVLSSALAALQKQKEEEQERVNLMMELKAKHPLGAAINWNTITLDEMKQLKRDLEEFKTGLAKSIAASFPSKPTFSVEDIEQMRSEYTDKDAEDIYKWKIANGGDDIRVGKDPITKLAEAAMDPDVELPMIEPLINKEGPKNSIHEALIGWDIVLKRQYLIDEDTEIMRIVDIVPTDEVSSK